MTMQNPVPSDHDAILTFVRAVPEPERAFYKDDGTDDELAKRWSQTDPLRLISVDDDGTVRGIIGIRRGQGKSAHVGEIMLVVHPDYRRQGVASGLVKSAIVEAMRADVTHIFVQVTAKQQSMIDMFRTLGFTGEALLRGFIKESDGQLDDLIMLTNRVEENWAAANAIGLDLDGEL